MGGNRRKSGQQGRGEVPRATSIATAIAGLALLCAPAFQASAKPNPIDPPGSANSDSNGKPSDNSAKSSGGSLFGGGNTADSVTVLKDQDLRFGKLVMTSTSGVVIVPATGLATYMGAVSIDAGSAVGPARFEIKGPPNRSIELELTFPLSGSYGMNGTAKLDNLSVAADFMTGFNQNGTLVRLKLDGSGTNAITVGGKLTFARNDAYGPMNILFPVNASVVK